MTEICIIYIHIHVSSDPDNPNVIQAPRSISEQSFKRTKRTKDIFLSIKMKKYGKKLVDGLISYKKIICFVCNSISDGQSR